MKPLLWEAVAQHPVAPTPLFLPALVALYPFKELVQQMGVWGLMPDTTLRERPHERSMPPTAPQKQATPPLIGRVDCLNGYQVTVINLLL